MADKEFEPGCNPSTAYSSEVAHYAYLKSIAISLKRIADKMEGPAERLARLKEDRQQNGFTAERVQAARGVDNRG